MHITTNSPTSLSNLEDAFYDVTSAIFIDIYASQHEYALSNYNPVKRQMVWLETVRSGTSCNLCLPGVG